MCEKRRGENNPNYGKHLSDVAKKKISNKNRGRLCGDNNPMRRPEVREKIIKSMGGDNNPAKRPEVRKKISDNNPMRRPEVREKVQESRKGKTSVFDLQTQTKVFIIAEEFRQNKDRYCGYTSKRYREYKQQLPLAA